jgi:hypothetical protein
MSLKLNENASPENSGKAEAVNNQAVNSNQTQQPGAEAAPLAMDFMGGGFYGGLIAPTSGSESVKKIHEALELALKDHKKDVELAIIDIDREVHTSLKFSAIVLALKAKTSDRFVSHITLIIEATGEPLKPYYQNVNGANVEVMRVTEDAYDAEMVRIVSQEVAKKFKASAYRPVEPTVIPRDFNPDDKAAVTRLAFHSTAAINYELMYAFGNYPELNLKAAKCIAGANLNIAMSVSRAPQQDVLGNPVRSDVILAFQTLAQFNKNNGQLVNNGDRERTFSQLSAFIDLVWNPVNPHDGFGNYPGMARPLQPGELPTQIYSARAVITDIKSLYALTPASVLLYLLPIVALSQNNNWFQTFRVTPSEDAVDLRDPGALNLEANLYNDNPGNAFGKKVDVHSNDFSLADLGGLLSQTIRPGLIISLDVPEAGPMTPFLSFLAAASMGIEKARATLVQAAHTLTDGAFPLNYSGPFFEDLDNRIHLGYWIDAKGVKRDIREIDLLAVANLCERDPSLIRKWTDTFDANTGPLVKRLATRWSMISSFTSEKAVCTGFARRITIHPNLIGTLFDGASKSGIHPQVQTPMSINEFNDRRAPASFAGAATMSPNLAFQPRSNGMPQDTFMGQGFGRYGM